MRNWLVLLLFLACPIFGSEQEVNVFVWADYIPQKVIQLFEKQTGIKVNLSEFDSNEDLYAKLKADPHNGYDVIVPSSYYIQRMVHAGMLRKIDHKALPNSRYLNPLLLNKSFDPGNQYSFPYLWGSTGIVVDTRYWDPKTIHRWRDLWQPRFRNQLLMYNDSREVFAMALIVLGRSINEKNPHYIKQAYEKLRELLPNIRIYSTDAATNVLADDDVTVGMAETGDVIRARLANSHLAFIYPSDGFAVWEDCVAIPRYAPHYHNALTFINFLMRPEIGVLISMTQGYSSPNMKTRQLLPKKFRDDPLMYPSQQTLKRSQMEGDIGQARELYMHYWELLKLQ